MASTSSSPSIGLRNYQDPPPIDFFKPGTFWGSDRKKFVTALKVLSSHHGHQLKPYKTNNGRAYDASCSVSQCPFKVRLAYKTSGWFVTSFTAHSSTQVQELVAVESEHLNKCSLSTEDIATMILPDLSGDPFDISPKQIASLLVSKNLVPVHLRENKGWLGVRSSRVLQQLKRQFSAIGAN